MKGAVGAVDTRAIAINVVKARGRLRLEARGGAGHVAVHAVLVDKAAGTGAIAINAVKARVTEQRAVVLAHGAKGVGEEARGAVAVTVASRIAGSRATVGAGEARGTILI